MEGLLRWGNVFAGKLVEALWWWQEPRFTDVGCTYRAIWKDAYLKIRDRLQGFGPESLARNDDRGPPAPANASSRFQFPTTTRTAGESKHSANYLKVSKTALKMLKLVLAKRFA